MQSDKEGFDDINAVALHGFRNICAQGADFALDRLRQTFGDLPAGKTLARAMFAKNAPLKERE